MEQQIWSAIAPILVTAAVAVLTAVITAIGNATVAFIRQKRDALIRKIGSDEYDRDLEFASQAWKMVDEFFRITPSVEKTVESTFVKFKEYMLAKVPGLTDAQLEDLRQTIAGEINEGREAITEPATTTTTEMPAK